MPISSPEVFRDISKDLDPSINPYVKRVVTASESASLPIKFGPTLQGTRGNWRELLSRNPSDPLLLEIGCHNGHTLFEIAQNHPEFGAVGIDITFKRIVKTAEKIEKLPNRNAMVALANARGLTSIFAPDELDYVVIFFPDPWCKKKSQAKKRLINEDFARTLFSLIRPGGGVWFKTDHQPYDQEGLRCLVEAGFAEVEQLDTLTENVYESCFERRFRLQGLSTFERRLRKQKPSC